MKSHSKTTLAFGALALAAQLATLSPSQAANKTAPFMRRSPQAVPAQNAQSSLDERDLEFRRPTRSTTHLGILLLGNMSAMKSTLSGASESQNQAVNDTVGRGFAPGAMLNLNTELGSTFALDLNAGYVSRKQNLDMDRALRDAGISGVTYEGSMTSNWIQVAPIVRLRFASVLSVGVGPYAAFRVGDYKINQKLTQNGKTTETNDSTSDAKSFDAGGVGALGARIPVGSNFELIADARYTLGLVNQSKESGDTVKYNDIQFLLGLGIGL